MKKLHILIATAALSLSATAQSRLTYDGFNCDNDNRHTMLIGLESDTAYTAMQCDIAIPSTLHFVAGDDGTYIPRSPRMTGTHLLSERLIDDTHLRVVVYSTTNQPFATPSANELFAYTVAPNVLGANVTGSTTISNIVMASVTTDDATTQVQCHESLLPELTFSQEYSTADAIGYNTLRIYASGMQIIVESPGDTTLTLTNVAGQTQPLHVKAGLNTRRMDTPGIYIVDKTKLILK